MGELGTTLITIVFTAWITSIVARFFKREEIEKVKAEKAAIDQKQIQGVIDMWKGMVEDLTADVKELTAEVEKLRNENRSLKIEMKKLEKLLNEKSA